MRLHPLRLALASCLVLAYVASLAGASEGLPRSAELGKLSKRDGDEHGHHHGVAPLLELNETEVTLYHQATPPSYYTIDWEDPDQADARHPGLIITHAIFMSLAFFIFLPMGIIMRSFKNAWHGVAVLSFYASFVVACAASSVYRKLTPDMYAGSTHANHGYRVLVVALALTFIDTLGALRRLIAFLRSANHYTLKGIAQALLGREDSDRASGPEYVGLIGEEPDRDCVEETKGTRHSYDVPDSHRTQDFSHGNTEQWANHVRTMSDGTLFGPSSPHSEETFHDIHIHSPPRISLFHRIGQAVFLAVERALIFAGFGLFLTGIVIYTGGCRQNYINGCLAHLIKGGIFWCYGLISFARFLGWCSERGWSWNRAPSSGYPTAEMVESTLVFLYGATNTWMERFGANPGDPFTTKQIQHIGIAVMFWFAGLIGMAMESKTIRRWLAALAVDTSENVSEPENYTSSFNPFPALVIGVTGSVMAAHSQVYLFQVQIHALWGNLLLAFAVMRCLTYFFLWVAPPRSKLPSRPPTEALASFFLTCGGLSFIFSTEEVTIMAMRRGRDDIMMFAVTAVAFTCLAFSWTIGVVGFQGWLKTRTKLAFSYHNSA
ncbi:cytoplasmic protein [Mycena albidolilacea]|uniref:Cytoplasmic protein n=1 Tax=Mycena albidolilacea TaxID=1033008 RepID=A0AAD7F6K0_9AGAR|nr:cytoplasmic protein [Mycena albidolilacea]